MSDTLRKKLSSPLEFRVWQNMSPPLKREFDITSYDGYPLTDVICRHPSALVSERADLRISQLVWDNRALIGSDGITKAWNLIPNVTCVRLVTSNGLECRTQFGDQAKAMAATRVQLAHVCGASIASCRHLAQAGGFAPQDIVPWAQVSFDDAIDSFFPDTWAIEGETYAVSRDKIFLSPWRIVDCQTADIWGVIIDLENQDCRSEADQREHLNTLVAIARQAGLKIGFFLNPANGDISLKFNGCTSDILGMMHENADMIWLQLGSKNPEGSGYIPQQFLNQIKVLQGVDNRKVEPAKLGINFEFGVEQSGTTIQDALDAYNVITSNKLRGGVWIWRNGAKFGPMKSRTEEMLKKQVALLFGENIEGADEKESADLNSIEPKIY